MLFEGTVVAVATKTIGGLTMSESITDTVRERYASVARSGISSDLSGIRAVAEAFGYTPEELASIPAGANMGLSCGNPTATANLREGEVVVDLGSGGGLDVFLAAQKVGPTGRAIGIDMTPDMISLANRNAEKRAADGGVGNVEFHLSTIDDLPLDSASVDCVISNCVINLATDKSKVFQEMARILKPGGRVAISDIALKKPLPPEIAADVTAYVGCIAGAISIDEYRNGLIDAGFEHVEILDSGADLNAYGLADTGQACCAPAPEAVASSASVGEVVQLTKPSGRALPVSGSYDCCSSEPAPDVLTGLADLLARANVNDYAASVRVFAVKPA